MFDIENYLDEKGFNLNFDYNQEIQKFIGQIDSKLAGKESSLGMLNSFIPVKSAITNNKNVIVVDAGGTNLRVTTLKIDNNGAINIVDFKKIIMPGVERLVSKDEFYSYIAKQIIPFDSFSDEIGFCFSYPVELLNSHEGIILRMCKEIKAPEVEGTKVCESLNKKIVELGGTSKKITLLNDSTATLLAGVVNSKSPNSGFIGVILGTGCNSCYVENGYVYNVESGWYDSLPRGQFDDELDKDSINPGKYFLEKSTSGAYLGSLATLIFKDLYSKGVIKTEVKQLSTTEINDFILGKSTLSKDEDTEIFYKVIERIILRSALFMAINLATLIIKTNLKGEVVYIVADGSTFHNLKDFRFTVENYLDEMLESNLMYEIISVDNAPVIGAAVSCLLAN